MDLNARSQVFMQEEGARQTDSEDDKSELSEGRIAAKSDLVPELLKKGMTIANKTWIDSASDGEKASLKWKISVFKKLHYSISSDEGC